MSFAPYTTLDRSSCVWQGYYAPRRCCYAMLFTPDPALHPPGPNGWKWAVHIHGGGMRQWGRTVAELGANAMWLELVNNLNIALVLITYTPGSFEAAEVQFPGFVLFPDNLRDAANAIQFFKTHRARAAVVGVNGLLSNNPDDITVSGLSAGGFVGAGSQLQEDGAYPYTPGAQSDDDWYAYTENHLANNARWAEPQLVFSTLSMGAEDPGDFPFNTYGNFGWPGSYGMDWHDVEDGLTWDSKSMESKRAMNLVELIRPDNPRIAEMRFYMLAPADQFNKNPIKNLANASDPLSFLNTTNTGRAHFDLTQRDSDFRDLHGCHQLFLVAYLLAAMGHIRWRMKVGDAALNPDAGAAVINPDKRTIANVSYVGTTITVDTSGPHGFLAGARVELSGVGSSGTLASLINKSTQLDSVTATQFVFTIGTVPTGSYTPGTGFVGSGRRYLFDTPVAPWTQADAQDFAHWLQDQTWGAGW